MKIYRQFYNKGQLNTDNTVWRTNVSLTFLLRVENRVDHHERGMANTKQKLYLS